MTEQGGQGGELDAERVRGLFRELSERLADRGVQAQLFVVGGAAMALAYDQGRLTRDVDALFVPAPAVRAAAEEISTVHGLEPDWLNDAAKGFLPGADEHPHTVFESESLLVQVASPEYLLAMKLHASRDERDLDDAATLFTRLGYTTAQQAIDLLSHTYPPDQLLPRHHYIAQDVAQRAAERNPGNHGEPPTTPTSQPPPAGDVPPSRQQPRAEAPEAGADRLRRSGRHEQREPPSTRPAPPPSIGF